MIDEPTLGRLDRHSVSHRMEMCTCPCFDALLQVAEAMKRENDLRVRVARVSPEVLAALTLSGEPDEPEALGEPVTPT